MTTGLLFPCSAVYDHVCQACSAVLKRLVCHCQTSQGKPVNEASAQSSCNMSSLIQQQINTGLDGKCKHSVFVTCSRCLDLNTLPWWNGCTNCAWPLFIFPYQLIKFSCLGFHIQIYRDREEPTRHQNCQPQWEKREHFSSKDHQTRNEIDRAVRLRKYTFKRTKRKFQLTQQILTAANK